MATAPLIGYNTHVVHKTMLAAVQTGAGWIPPAKYDAVAAEVTRQCDPLDGLVDGVIGNHLGCAAMFDPLKVGHPYAAIRCAQGADTGDTCVSDSQIATLNQMHAPTSFGFELANGWTAFPGYGAGREAFPAWLTANPQPSPATQPALGQPGATVSYGILKDPSFNLVHFGIALFANQIRAASEIIDSTNPDLSAFFAYGGRPFSGQYGQNRHSLSKCRPMQSSKASDFKIDIAADLHKWRAFVAIGELGSLTRAALFLDSNQSLLSRQLNALERECGARLFNRTGRGVELSETGSRLFPQVKALLADAERLENEIRGEAKTPSGRVTLGSLPSIGMPLVSRLFSRTRAEFPGISLKVLEGSSGQVDEWLADARVDIAILYRYGPTLPETEQSLAVVDSCLLGPPGDRLTAAAEVAFDTLNELPFILPSAPNGLRTALDAIARQRRITLAPVIEADSLPLQKGLVANERLYTVLPIHAAWAEVKDKRLQAARIVDPSVQRTIAMAMSKSKGPPRAVSAVASLIVDIVEDMARDGMWTPARP